MPEPVRDIAWLSGLTPALALARERRRAVVLKAVMQGLGADDAWGPDGAYTRAVSFSDPAVARRIATAFVPVLCSMHLEGPGADAAARAFVLRQALAGGAELHPPDLFVLSPDEQVLGRLGFDATPAETLAFLDNVLARRPDLAPAPAPVTAEDPPPDAAELALAALARQYDSHAGREHLRRWETAHALVAAPAPGAKAALVPALEAWLAAHAARLPDAAALARTLLAGAHYHAGAFDRAYALWGQVPGLHPAHPLRHRARYNAVRPGAVPSLPHPELSDAPAPRLTAREVLVPDAAVRAANLARARSEGGAYRWLHGLPFVRVPAGTFTMGGTPALQAREQPTRRVALRRAFWLSAWPVTRALWRRFRHEDFPGDEHAGLAAELPAAPLAWRDAAAFCAFLRGLDGPRFRLPTEAEWEYAARGGRAGAQYPWGDSAPGAADCNFLNPWPVPVASYPANGYGLFDCVGNTAEWTADYYLADAYARTGPEVADPPGPSAAEAQAHNGGNLWRVARGGGWTGDASFGISCRTAWRIGWPEAWPWGNVALRVALDADDGDPPPPSPA